MPFDFLFQAGPTISKSSTGSGEKRISNPLGEFGAEVVAGAVGGEADQAGEERTELAVGQVAEVLTKSAPDGAGLEGAVAGIFLFGVFGDGFFVGTGQPAPDVEGGNVEIVFLLFAQCNGFSHAFAEGQAGAFCRVHIRWRMSGLRAEKEG